MLDRSALAGLAARDIETDRVRSHSPPRSVRDGPLFQQVLEAQFVGIPSPIRFSEHARRRLEERGIPFGEEELAKLEQAVSKAASKGARDSLVLMGGLALVVSVKNRIVVTAVDAVSRKDNVFTNIDSVVLS